jgi:adenosylhomocysteine nucleosidase
MLLRHLVSHFLQQQAKAKFSEAMRGGASAAPKSVPRASPLLVDGLIVYPSDLDAGGVLDLTKEKQTTHCETLIEQSGVFGSRRIALVELGEGEVAGKNMACVLKLIRPLWVISIGFASGLSPTAQRGQILMASRIINEKGDARRVGLALAADQSPPPGIHWGDLLTVGHLPKTSAAKKLLAASGATAWDADSYFVAEAAAGLPTFISVRIISEAIDDELPKAIQVFRDQKSIAAKLGAAAGALFEQPSSLAAMWKMRDEAIKLSDRLGKFLVGVVEQLPRREPSTEQKKT